MTFPSDADDEEKASPRKKLQFSLRSLLLLATALSAITGFIIVFPQVALVAAVVLCGIVVVLVVLFAVLAEGAFWDWLAAKLDQSEHKNDNKD